MQKLIEELKHQKAQVTPQTAKGVSADKERMGTADKKEMSKLKK